MRRQAQRIIVDTLSCVLAAHAYPPAAILERVLGAGRVEAAADLLFALEQVEDVREVTRALSLQPSS